MASDSPTKATERRRNARRKAAASDGQKNGVGRDRSNVTEAHAAKLQRIKEISAELFYSLGYAGTDLRSIADAADMHVTTLYNYIAEKEELLYLIMLDGMTEIAASLDAALAAHPDDYVLRLRAAVKSHIMHHIRHRHLAKTSLTEIHALNGQYLEDILGHLRRYENRWRELVREGMSTGVLREADVRMTVFGLLAPGRQVSQWYNPRRSIDADSIATVLSNQALNGVMTT